MTLRICFLIAVFIGLSIVLVGFVHCLFDLARILHEYKTNRK